MVILEADDFALLIEGVNPAIAINNGLEPTRVNRREEFKWQLRPLLILPGLKELTVTPDRPLQQATARCINAMGSVWRSGRTADASRARGRATKRETYGKHDNQEEESHEASRRGSGRPGQ